MNHKDVLDMLEVALDIRERILGFGVYDVSYWTKYTVKEK